MKVQYDPIGSHSYPVYDVNDYDLAGSTDFIHREFPIFDYGLLEQYVKEGITMLQSLRAFAPGQKFYEWTFVQTGNNYPMSDLPDGMKAVYISRPGTTSTVVENVGFNPVSAGGVQAIKTLLTNMLSNSNSQYLAFKLRRSGTLLGQFAFAEDTFFGRTSLFRKVRTAVPVADLQLSDIQPVDTLQGISAVPTANFQNWTTTREAYLPRFTHAHFERQSMFGGAAWGIGEGLSAFGQALWQSNRDQLNRDLRLQLAKQNGQNALDLQTLRYQQRMSELGYSSPGAQTGRLTTTGTDPQSRRSSISSTTSKLSQNTLDDVESLRTDTPSGSSGTYSGDTQLPSYKTNLTESMSSGHTFDEISSPLMDPNHEDSDDESLSSAVRSATPYLDHNQVVQPVPAQQIRNTMLYIGEPGGSPFKKIGESNA